MTKEEWIDISLPLKTGMAVYPGDSPVAVSREADVARGDRVTLSRISMGLHAGTHVDAPLHLFEKGASIAAIPPGRLIGLALVIAVGNEASIDVPDVAGEPVEEGRIILFKTRNSALWSEGAFCRDYVSLSPAAARYLVDRKVRAVGIDYMSIDGYGKGGLAAHALLLGASIPIIEGLDLSSVSPGLYDCLCLPLLLEAAEAAPARVVVRRREDPGPR